MNKELTILLLSLCYVTMNAQTSKIGKTVTLTYDDGMIAKEKWYNIHNTIDSLKTYTKTGKLTESFYYDSNEEFNGLCYQLTHKGEKQTTWLFEHGKLIERIDYIKPYHFKNKERVLKRYETLKNCNSKLKKKYSHGTMRIRAYARHYLKNTVLAERDFLIIKENLEKRNVEKRRKTPPRLMASVFDILGSIYDKYEDEDKAIHYKYLAIQTNPKEYRYYHNLGAYLILQKNYQLGIYYLNKVVESDSDHPFSNWLLGIAHSDIGNYKLALKHTKKAAAMEHLFNSGSIGTAERTIKTTEGYLYHKLGKTKKGIKKLKKALEEHPNNSFAIRNLGEVYYDLKKFSKACALFNEAKKLGYEKHYDRNDLQYFIDQTCSDIKNTTIKNNIPPRLKSNPVLDHLEVINYTHNNFSYIITDDNKKIVSEGVSNGAIVDTSYLNSGLYKLLLIKGVKPCVVNFIKE